MTKPFTEDDLANQLSQDLTWRLREISDLKAAALGADNAARAALLRAVVAIAYAHWEGHVRFSARKYLTHISLRKLTFASLTRQFLRNDFLARLATMGHKGLEERGALIDAILEAGSSRFKRFNEELVNTKSNLNSEVLREIYVVCGVDPTVFQEHQGFIDVILLKRRNSIAHGEDTFIHVGELDNITEGTVSLMRLFSNQLQANAYLRHYRAA